MRRPRLLSAVALAAALASADCSSDTQYVHIFVQGSGGALTSQPFTVQASAFARGKHVDIEFPTSLHAAQSPATQPYTDFAVEIGGGASPTLDVRVVTKGAADAAEWGGDIHLAPPRGGQSVVIDLAQGERKPFPSEVFSLLGGDMSNAALFGGSGLALGWVDESGVRELVLVEPDRPVGRARVVCPTCLPAKALRIASRPLSPFGSELYALAWRDDEGLKLKTTTRTDTENAIVSLTSTSGQPISEIGLGCFKKGAAADVVALRLEGQDVVATLHDASGALVGAAKVGVTGKKERSIVGVLTGVADGYTVGVRGTDSRLVRVGIDGTAQSTAVIDGDLRGIGLSADGNRVIVTTSQTSSSDVARLDFSVYSATDLVRIGAPQTLTERAFLPGTTSSQVSIASCAIAWAEKRDDGGEDIDVRLQRLDENDEALGAPTFGNVSLTGQWALPTVVCASPTRAFITFFDRASDQTGNLFLRRLP